MLHIILAHYNIMFRIDNDERFQSFEIGLSIFLKLFNNHLFTVPMRNFFFCFLGARLKLFYCIDKEDILQKY